MPSHRFRRSPLVAAPRGSLVIALVLWAATFLLGFIAKASPAWLAAQLSVNRAVNTAHGSFLDSIALALDNLDSVRVVAVCLAILGVLVGLFVSWPRALAAVLIAGGGWLFCLIPKAVVAEPRPPWDAISYHLHVTHATLSYPSGHTVFAVTLTMAVVLVCTGLVSRIIAAVVGVLFVATTAWSRVYVGAHYATDILGAVLAGVAGALLVAWLWNLVVRALLRGRRMPTRR
ncbi:phosphatase PAP2 family protein [Humibacter albus]|uniref:phosphatase PAP2 family protein n=1 Tax=Humibacter albus TaxID=427754 RepID=UPI0003B78D8E|nr:phosphatase PAP2 family protein [Humibacter albus]